MDDPIIEQQIKQDEEDLKFFNVRATPTFFVNGRPLMKFGYQPLYELIDQEVMANY